MEYVEYEPEKTHKKPIPIHDLASALRLSWAVSEWEDGNLPQPTDVDLGALLAEMKEARPVA